MLKWRLANNSNRLYMENPFGRSVKCGIVKCSSCPGKENGEEKGIKLCFLKQHAGQSHDKQAFTWCLTFMLLIRESL